MSFIRLLIILPRIWTKQSANQLSRMRLKRGKLHLLPWRLSWNKTAINALTIVLFLSSLPLLRETKPYDEPLYNMLVTGFCHKYSLVEYFVVSLSLCNIKKNRCGHAWVLQVCSFWIQITLRLLYDRTTVILWLQAEWNYSIIINLRLFKNQNLWLRLQCQYRIFAIGYNQIW